MDRQKDLEKLRKEELVAMLDDLAEVLEKEIPVTGNKDEIIGRILAAESQVQQPNDSEDDDEQGGDDTQLGDQDSGDSEDTEDDLPEDGEISIKALATFETMVGREKVLVCKDSISSLPEAAAQAAIDEGLAEEV